MFTLKRDKIRCMALFHAAYLFSVPVRGWVAIVHVDCGQKVHNGFRPREGVGCNQQHLPEFALVYVSVPVRGWVAIHNE